MYTRFVVFFLEPRTKFPISKKKRKKRKRRNKETFSTKEAERNGTKGASNSFEKKLFLWGWRKKERERERGFTREEKINERSLSPTPEDKGVLRFRLKNNSRARRIEATPVKFIEHVREVDFISTRSPTRFVSFRGFNEGTRRRRRRRKWTRLDTTSVAA